MTGVFLKPKGFFSVGLLKKILFLICMDRVECKVHVVCLCLSDNKNWQPYLFCFTM